MEAGDDWGGQDPTDDPVYTDSSEDEPVDTHTRPQIYNETALFELLEREIRNRLISIFPSVTESSAIAILLQRNFQFDRVLQQLSTLSIEQIHQMYNIGQEGVTLERGCMICEELETKEMTTCCNLICSQCLNTYIAEEVQKNELLVRCPNSECGKVILYKLLPQFLIKRYEQKLGVAYARSMKTAFECCLDCSHYIRVPLQKQSYVSCEQSCGCKICLECHTFCHRPLSCQEVVKWSAKIVSEGLSMQYINRNTKKCPGCKVNIEKNEGCNHMTCRQCKHEFCWICFVDWKTHCSPGYKGCTKFIEKAEQGIEVDKQRFYFYCERFQAFQESEDAAYKLRNGAMVEKIKALEIVLERPVDEFDFLRTGMNSIIQGRRIIKYLYAYLCIGKISSAKQDIVEHNLSTAQHNLEHLHGLVESAIKSQEIHDFEFYTKLRSEVRSYSSVTDRFLQNIANEFSK